MVSSSKQPKAEASVIHMTQCALKGGRNGISLGPNSRAKLSHCTISQSSQELILLGSNELDADNVEFNGGLSAIKSAAIPGAIKTLSKLSVSNCRFQDQRSHVFNLVNNSELRCVNSTIDHKAKGQIAFWARHRTKMAISNTKILNEGGICFVAVNNAIIEAKNCTLEKPFSVAKAERNGRLRLVDSTASEVQSTAVNNFKEGQIQLIRCQFLKGKRAAISLCFPDSRTIMEDCLIRGFTQGLLLNSPKPLKSLVVKGCRFEESQFIAIEIRGELGEVKFEDNKITNNDMGLFIERKNRPGGSTRLSIESSEFRANKTHAVLMSGSNIFLKLNNCRIEGHGRNKSKHWDKSAIYVERGSQLEIRGGSIERNEGPALNNHSGKIRVFPGVKIGQNKGGDKGVILRD